MSNVNENSEISVSSNQSGKRFEGLAKLVVDLPPETRSSAETLWVRPLESSLFKLENVPVFAYGIALDDVVDVVYVDDDDRPHFKSVVQPSGLLTIRIAAEPQADRARFEKLREILKNKCVATEAYGSSYVAFAFDRLEFQSVEDEAEAYLVEDEIYLEVANQIEQQG